MIVVVTQEGEEQQRVERKRVRQGILQLGVEGE